MMICLAAVQLSTGLALVSVLITITTTASQQQSRSRGDESSHALFTAIVLEDESEAIRLIKNGGNAYMCFQLACEAGLAGVIEAFIMRDHHELSFLRRMIYYAAREGHEKVVKILISHGGDVNFQDDQGSTPLHEAALRGYEKVAEVLLYEGANPHLEDKYGMTPRDWAIEKGFQKIVDLLHPRRLAVSKLQKICDLLREKFSIYFDKNTHIPWMAALGYVNKINPKFKCSGTIISDRWILTAAHCVEATQRPIVRLGVSNLDDRIGQNYHVEEVIKHPEYSKVSKRNDIALIRLTETIRFLYGMRPACLETDLEDLNPTMELIVSGWGNVFAQRNKQPKKLRMAEFVTVPLSECNQIYLDYNLGANHIQLKNGITESQYCAHNPNGKNDFGQGGSGGPLQVMLNSDTVHVVGIASFGVSNSRLPVVFTRVAYYAEWIAENISWESEDRFYTN